MPCSARLRSACASRLDLRHCAASALRRLAPTRRPPARVLQGQERRALHRLQRRRRLRSLCARRSPAISASTFPGNPTIVPKNMEGAGSLRLANWLYNVGSKDGTAIATIGRGTAFDPLLGSKGAQFQADKFTWIGSANNEVSVCVAWKTSGITTLEEVDGQGADRRRHRRRPPTPTSFRASSTACSAPSSRSSPAIPAATTSRWRWSAAR